MHKSQPLFPRHGWTIRSHEQVLRMQIRSTIGRTSMPNVPWEFRDLCSTEGLRRSKKVEDTPFDNITFWLSSPSAESAGVCEQLERDSFLKTIAPCDQLRKSVPSAHATT